MADEQKEPTTFELLRAEVRKQLTLGQIDIGVAIAYGLVAISDSLDDVSNAVNNISRRM